MGWGGVGGVEWLSAFFLPSNSERSVSQTHSGLVPVWSVRWHIHKSMAVTVGQSVGVS